MGNDMGGSLPAHKERFLANLAGVPFIFVLVCLFTATLLRISLLVFYPVLAGLVFFSLRLKITGYITDLLLLIGIGWLLSFINGFYPTYNLLSLYYMVPFLVLLFAVPGRQQTAKRDMVRVFFFFFSIIGVLNDIAGIVQVIRLPASDDNFSGLYSTFSLSINGLAVVNSLLFIYYCFAFLSYRRRSYLIGAVFFLVCSIMGFYGAGLVVLIVAFMLTFFNARISSVIKTVLISAIAVGVAYYALSVIKPKALKYNKTNFEKVLHFNPENGPRKIVAFNNYIQSYPYNIKDFLFGSGPGTYDSRSAFMIGSPSFFTAVSAIKSDRQPYYFAHFAYPLWNDSNTSQELYQDGFRNQPFSSLLSFLGEYGFIFTFFFVWYLYRLYRKTVPAVRPVNAPPAFTIYTRLYKFLLLMLLLLLVIDNYMEYAEITLLITVILKLLHAEMQQWQPPAPPGQAI